MNYLNGLKTLIAVVIATLAFTSCSEEQTSLSIDDIPGKAKIIGSFTFNDGQRTSSSSTSNVDKPVANQTVYVKIQNASISPSHTGNGYTTFETTTNANGEYEIEIPAVETGVTVIIQGAPFIGKKYSTSSNTITGGTTITTKDGVYEATPITLNSVTPNDIIAAGKTIYGFTAFDSSAY